MNQLLDINYREMKTLTELNLEQPRGPAWR